MCHSTAPNRRYPDVITQRMLKAAIAGEPCPYTEAELEELATHCNKQESSAKGAQRAVTKAAVGHYLTSQIGKEYAATVTGRKKHGIFVKVSDVPIEGKVVVNDQGLEDWGQGPSQTSVGQHQEGVIWTSRILPLRSPRNSLSSSFHVAPD